MSDHEEQNSPLADVERGEEVDSDQAAAMQQMMGFSTFGGPQKPKRQPRNPGSGRGFGTGANTQPIQPRKAQTPTTASRKSSVGSQPFVPASLPPRLPTKPSVSPPPPSDHDTIATDAEFAADPASTVSFPGSIIAPSNLGSAALDFSHNDVAYTNAHTGYTLTRRELMAYERGIMEHVVNNGVTSVTKVYFKPNFIEDNPWEGLEARTAERPRFTS